MSGSKKSTKNESVSHSEVLKGSVEASGPKTSRPKTPPPTE